MTTTIAYADASDGRLISTAVTYASARAGTGTITVNSAETTLPYGQSYNGSTYGVSVSYLRWAHTPPAGEQVTGAAFQLHHASATGAAVARDLEIRASDWGTTLEAADWVASTAWGGLALFGTAVGTQSASGKVVLAGSASLVSHLNFPSTTHVRVMLTSKNARTGATPTADEVSYVSAVDMAGTAYDPALIYTTSPASTLYGTLGAQVRMGDGAWCVLESDGASTPTITLRRHDGTSATTLGTVPVDIFSSTLASPDGAQALTLATDHADRVYVLGRIGNAANTLAVLPYARSGGVWSAGTMRTVALPAYGGRINNLAACVFPTGGAYGELYVVAGHGPDAAVTGGAGNELSHVRLSCEAIVTGVGTVSIASGTALGSVQPERTRSTHWSTYANETGTGLDVDTPGTGRVAYVSSFPKGSTPGDLDTVYVGRGDYDAATGSYTATAGYAVKDGGGKLRVIATGGSTVCVISADRDADYGITITPYQVSGSTWTPLSDPILLDSEAITSMPAASAVAVSQAWDAVYYAPSNKLWVYYCPSDRTVRRTSVDLSSYQAVRDSITVATIGAAGGTNLAIRTSRNGAAGATALVTVAHKASGGTLSTSYLVDSLNQAPSAPILAPRSNFDATTSVPLSWTFVDADPGDAQTAYELEIINASTEAVVVSTGKVVSGVASRTITAGTLTNGVSYLWKVRTYDSSDVVGAWSDPGAFSTAAGGTLTITAPTADYPAGVVTDDYAVTWSVAGATQAAYRVILVRVGTGATVTDTGWVASTSTTYTVTGMLSDVEYEIRVQARNASAVTTNQDTRRIVPSYATPEVPLIEITPRGDLGYTLVQVDNVTPLGPSDRPPATGNEVYRRVEGAESWDLLSAVALDAQYRDYTAASGVTYEYKARAIAAGSYADSEVAAGCLSLEGVWLHDPLDPTGTARQLRYGRALRSLGIDVESSATHYAGRELPVADFGEAEAQSLRVLAPIPHGADGGAAVAGFRTASRWRRSVVVRDNRGRSLAGRLSGYLETDRDYGTDVSFVVDATDGGY